MPGTQERSFAPDERPHAGPAEAQEELADADELLVKFSPEEESELVADSNTHKTEANGLFSSGRYEGAISKYEEAAAVCPNYLDFELAVLKSNISACCLKLEEWREAMSSATAALERLDNLEKRQAEETAKEDKAPKTEMETTTQQEGDEEVEAEIVSSGAAKAGPALTQKDDPAEASKRKLADDVARIRAKALMRRARARSELGGWSNLSGAEEDYKRLSGMTNLSSADSKLVNAQLRRLPAMTKAAQEKEMGEMWGKLKDLGNGILKPFGLSTENFQMVKDENTGGYSMNFKSGNAQ